METSAPPPEHVNSDGVEKGDEQHHGHSQRTEQELRTSISPADSQSTPQQHVPRRIHIVGTGSIGRVVAHSLRGIDSPPPISLVFHRYRLLEAWEKSKKTITLQDDEYVVPRAGFDVELVKPYQQQHNVQVPHGEHDVYSLADETGLKPHQVANIITEQKQQESSEEQPTNEASAEYRPLGSGKSSDQAISKEPIHNLIITTKTIRTVNALLAIKHRISKDTTICFLQNGMGVIDDVNEKVFVDEATRPTYVQGVISHGANIPPDKVEHDPFYVVHAGKGTIALSVVPKQSPGNSPEKATGPETGHDGKLAENQLNDLAPTARYLIRTLSRTPALGGVPFTPHELLQLQLEKLVVNTIINPLTALLDNRNGTIMYNFALSRTMRLMLAETSLIIRSLPELRGVPNVSQRFSTERLEAFVVNFADKTKNNISSMLADVRAGRETEIEYINGYIVRRGEELGIKAVVNYAIMQIVIGKSLMTEREFDDSVPVAGEGEGVNRE